MSVYLSIFQRAALFSLFGVLLLPLGAMAQSITTSGDFCNVRNPGGQPALEGTRKQNGSIQNILSDFQFTISCPLLTFYPSTNFNVGITAGNTNKFTQTFKCTLQEFEPFSNSVVRSYSKSLALGPNSGDLINFSDINISNSVNRLYMWCSLPPGGELGDLYVDSN